MHNQGRDKGVFWVLDTRNKILKNITENLENTFDAVFRFCSAEIEQHLQPLTKICVKVVTVSELLRIVCTGL